jgi:hypothetical protein
MNEMVAVFHYLYYLSQEISGFEHGSTWDIRDSYHGIEKPRMKPI